MAPPDRDPTDFERAEADRNAAVAEARALEKQAINAAHAERQAVGDRARSTIQRQEGEAERRHDHEDWEREMGIRCR